MIVQLCLPDSTSIRLPHPHIQLAARANAPPKRPRYVTLPPRLAMQSEELSPCLCPRWKTELNATKKKTQFTHNRVGLPQSTRRVRSRLQPANSPCSSSGGRSWHVSGTEVLPPKPRYKIRVLRLIPTTRLSTVWNRSYVDIILWFSWAGNNADISWRSIHVLPVWFAWT